MSDQGNETILDIDGTDLQLFLDLSEPQLVEAQKRITELEEQLKQNPSNKDIMALKDRARKDKEELDSTKAKLDELNQTILSLQADKERLEEQANKVGSYEEELSKTKQALEDANKSVEELSGKALGLHKRLLVTEFGVNEESIKDKNIEQLGLFEEALKALASSKGGNYATRTGGAGGTRELTPIEKAYEEIKDAERAGHVYRAPSGEPTD